MSPALAALAAPAQTVSISARDYPDDVRPGHDAFEVRMHYALAADGAVSGCEVIQSSRQPSLDAASCRILRERARFRDASGEAAGEIRFRWLGDASLASPAERGAPLLVGLPRRMSSEERRAIMAEDRGHGGAEVEVDVSEEGVPIACTVDPASAAAALARWMCARMMEAVFIPASNGAGGRARGRFRTHVGWG